MYLLTYLFVIVSLMTIGCHGLDSGIGTGITGSKQLYDCVKNELGYKIEIDKSKRDEGVRDACGRKDPKYRAKFDPGGPCSYSAYAKSHPAQCPQE